ncbi:MAG: TetR/AcrR family transcriptional regulator [Desulfamplus sp.]|nr:TetR/AcrR family transcriptional regulator [Desulfamplus sp.]MBF0211857.1 TetR/AcrR family transcriptional regulator [Desulfamplus sp.]MBF0241991.1 TetR/AcrR family transcriptional regulator [Desulfamplus sp.]MBF0389244.1 TetR/AcrR family transcriptional regulator [Desulfamplus sp.]
MTANLNAQGVPTQIKNPELVKERRRQIVDATVHLFVEHGYHKTTTRMIARAAGFSIGSLYEYVSCKEDVLYLVCEAIHGEVQRAVEEALSGSAGNGRATLAEVIREYCHVCNNMNDHILLMYQVSQFLPKQWKIKALENELRITDIFINALLRLSGKGDIPKLDHKTASLVGHNISVIGQMWAFRRWYLAKNFSIDEYIEYQTKFILGLVFQNIQPKEAT